MKWIFLLVLPLAACRYSYGPDTPIVQEVRAMGGGDPAHVSPNAIRRWFFEHREFATHIATECRVSAHPLGYADSTEGKVCAAAAELQIQKAGRDHEGF